MKFYVNSTENIVISAIIEKVCNHSGKRHNARENEIFGDQLFQYMELVSDVSRVSIFIIRGLMS
jgi:hypothetical protein